MEEKELTPYELKRKKIQKFKNDEFQISLFEMKHDELRNGISEISIDNITPIEAINKLNALKKKIEKDK